MSFAQSPERRESLQPIVAELKNMHTSLSEQGIENSDIKGVLDDLFNGEDMNRHKEYFEENYDNSSGVDEICKTVTDAIESYGEVAVKAAIGEVFGEIPNHMYM